MLGVALVCVMLARVGDAAAWQPVDDCRPVWDALPSAYHVNEAGYSGVSLGLLRSVLQSSFGAWSTACEAGGFRAVDAGTTTQSALNPADAQHVIEFYEDPWPAELGEASIVFATTLSVYTQTGSDCRNLRADLVFNAGTHAFTVNADEGGTDLQTVATHEVGHWLGLDHSSVPQATMGFEYAGREQRILHADDVAGVDALYPPDCPCARDEDCLSGEICEAGECVPRPCEGDEDCAVGLLCDLASASCVPPPCASDADCLGDQRCDTGAGDCVPTGACPTCRECEIADDCGGQPYQCVDGVARERVCTSLCTSTRDCPGDSACFTVDEQPFSICLNEDAAADGICPIGYECTPRPCDLVPCADDELCDASGECAPTGGADGCIVCDVCENDLDCPGGTCWSFSGQRVCSTLCSGDADCPRGTECQVFAVGDMSQQLCLNPLRSGSACPTDFVCGEGVPEATRGGSGGGCVAVPVGPWWAVWPVAFAAALVRRRRLREGRFGRGCERVSGV
ncbi:MAG: hypothetical protein ACI81R_000268 [Bradymonadia bacterium]|jgi:hypothetical protein